MKTPETEKNVRKPAERILILLILAAILILFAFFLRDILIPFLRMELRHDLDGATELLVLVIVVLAALLFGLIALFIKRFCFRGTDGTPDSLMYAIIFFIVRLWRGNRQNVEIRDEPLRGLQGPYILLANHESFFDFYYISMMTHPRNPDYLVNEYYCTRPVLRHMAREAGILSKRLFTPDLTSGVSILRMLRKGFPVVIFPEGRLSPDGRTNPIVEPGGAFYKRLKVPLVLTRLDGAYFADPKWRPRTYRSDIRVSVERVITPEQMVDMTPAELDGVIAETLYNDASAAPRSVYRHRDRACGLEGILYRCADCGSLYTTVSRGCELRCTACGRSHFLDEQYHFTDDAVSIPAYYDRLRRMEAEVLDKTALHAPVRVKIFGANGGPVRREKGECFLDGGGFRYRSAAGSEFSVPPERLPALAFSCGKEFELYHGDELYYFYPAEHPQQAARWALYADLAAQRRREKENAHEAE